MESLHPVRFEPTTIIRTTCLYTIYVVSAVRIKSYRSIHELAMPQTMVCAGWDGLMNSVKYTFLLSQEASLA